MGKESISTDVKDNAPARLFSIKLTRLRYREYFFDDHKLASLLRANGKAAAVVKRCVKMSVVHQLRCSAADPPIISDKKLLFASFSNYQRQRRAGDEF